MIVWGGMSAGGWLRDGARYDPVIGAWSPLPEPPTDSVIDAPLSVWTGSEMIVWGQTWGRGRGETWGARYDPRTDMWASFSTQGDPGRRSSPTAVWTGSEMIVWGGIAWASGSVNGAADGARYDPRTDTWATISTHGAPSGRYLHTAVWTGSEMIVWGGLTGLTAPRNSDWFLGDGARYDPARDAWSPVATENAPRARSGHVALWMNVGMIIWGGLVVGDGGIYRPPDNS